MPSKVSFGDGEEERRISLMERRDLFFCSSSTTTVLTTLDQRKVRKTGINLAKWVQAEEKFFFGTQKPEFGNSKRYGTTSQAHTKEEHHIHVHEHHGCHSEIRHNMAQTSISHYCKLLCLTFQTMRKSFGQSAAKNLSSATEIGSYSPLGIHNCRIR